mmetsp:Transcript_48854/g.116083  ORF Transcript_48854/g.116083 Transcript_48854/m.116083 type:complete len:392 (+) Transcript_48854:570-1745(+)
MPTYTSSSLVQSSSVLPTPREVAAAGSRVDERSLSVKLHAANLPPHSARGHPQRHNQRSEHSGAAGGGPSAGGAGGGRGGAGGRGGDDVPQLEVEEREAGSGERLGERGGRELGAVLGLLAGAVGVDERVDLHDAPVPPRREDVDHAQDRDLAQLHLGHARHRVGVLRRARVVGRDVDVHARGEGEPRLADAHAPHRRDHVPGCALPRAARGPQRVGRERVARRARAVRHVEPRTALQRVRVARTRLAHAVRGLAARAHFAFVGRAVGATRLAARAPELQRRRGVPDIQRRVEKLLGLALARDAEVSDHAVARRADPRAVAHVLGVCWPAAAPHALRVHPLAARPQPEPHCTPLIRRRARRTLWHCHQHPGPQIHRRKCGSKLRRRISDAL